MDLLEMYPRRFYEQFDSNARSASHVVPVVYDLLRPRSVVDVGCGTGCWLAEFKKAGVTDVLGVDGDWVPPDMLAIPPNEYLSHDLREPLVLDRRFDLVMLLETAEHLPESSAEGFVKSLVDLGSTVLFSAAVPNQGGEWHLNEQPLAWWEALFAKHGYECQPGFGARFVVDPNVDWWYVRNMVFFVRKSVGGLQ